MEREGRSNKVREVSNKVGVMNLESNRDCGIEAATGQVGLMRYIR